MMIIGITGTIGAGKGTVVEYLVEKYHFVHFSVRDFLKHEVAAQQLPLNRDSLTAVANALRAQHSPSYIVDQLLEQASQQPQHAIIESIRTIGEVESLRQKADFVLLAVDADVETRYQRITLRKSETDHIDFQTFLSNEAREMANTDPDKQNLSECMRRADIIINNDGDLAALHQQIDQFCQANGII